jgi:hypothetical protein
MASLNLPDAHTSYFRCRTKVAHRVEGGEVIGAPRKRAGVGQLQVSEGWLETKGDPGRHEWHSKKRSFGSATAGGFISWQSGEGRDTRSGGTPRGWTATRCRRFMKIVGLVSNAIVPITGLNVRWGRGRLSQKPFPTSKVNLCLSNPPPHPNKAS